MTNTHPPRVALWLLERLVPDNEPLVGDLIESFEGTRSRWWFWRQVLAAIVMSRIHGSREIRPLQLVDRQPGETSLRPALDRGAINITGSPLPDIGGLGLVALAFLVSVTAPGTWWVVLIVMLNGILLGALLVLIKQMRTR